MLLASALNPAGSFLFVRTGLARLQVGEAMGRRSVLCQRNQKLRGSMRRKFHHDFFLYKVAGTSDLW